MPWLEPLDWTYPPTMQGTADPYLLWTSETTFALLWLTNVTEGDSVTSTYCRQDFDVSSGSIEEAGEPQLLTGVATGVNPGNLTWVSYAQAGPDGVIQVEASESGGT